MIFNIKSISESEKIATTTDYYITIEKEGLTAYFDITHIKTGSLAFSGQLNISDNSCFELTTESEDDIYLISNFGNEFFQFKQEDYGIVIDAFSKDGEVINEYGYTITSDFEKED